MVDKIAKKVAEEPMENMDEGNYEYMPKMKSQHIDHVETERLVEICSKLDATCYISGISGKDYLNEELFSNSGIKLIYENFIHPTYRQLHGNFIDNLSIIDLLMNEGPRSKKIINDSTNLP